MYPNNCYSRLDRQLYPLQNTCKRGERDVMRKRRGTVCKQEQKKEQKRRKRKKYKKKRTNKKGRYRTGSLQTLT
jgi:hypothetical protein